MKLKEPQGRSAKNQAEAIKGARWVLIAILVTVLLCLAVGCAQPGPSYDLPLVCGGVARVHPGNTSECKKGISACHKNGNIYLAFPDDKETLAHEAAHACGMEHGAWIQRNGRWCAPVKTNGKDLRAGDWLCQDGYRNYVKG